MKKIKLFKYIVFLSTVVLFFIIMRKYIAEIMDMKFITVNIVFTAIVITGIYLLIDSSVNIKKKLYQDIFNDYREYNVKSAENFKIEELNDIIIKYYLQKQELETAKEAAETQARAKEIFLQNMSHEIRTPLNGIVITSEMLRYTNLDEKQKRYVYTIMKVSDTLVGVINNILDYSKIQSHKLGISKSEFSIRELSSELRLFFITGGKDEVYMFHTVKEDVPERVIADSFRIKQILINIIGNAVKFTEKGYIEVEMSFKNRVENTGTAVFKIKDSGIGIPKEKKEMIFRSFMQADESISRRYGGTGLGLAISKEIAEAMGGKITFESIAKEGSSFYVEIPVEIVKDRIEIEFNNESIVIGISRKDILNNLLKIFAEYNLSTYVCETAEEVEEVWKESGKDRTVIIAGEEFFNNCIVNNKMNEKLIIIKEGKNKKIENEVVTVFERDIEQQELINKLRVLLGYREEKKENIDVEEIAGVIRKKIALIEDNDVNAKAVAEIIEKFGAEIKVFDNGIEALKDIKQNNYDLVISDIQLPDLSGFELLKLIREYDCLHGNKRNIIALTAHALPEYREKCLRAGFDDYISKPVTMKELYRVIALNTGEEIVIEDNSFEKMEEAKKEIFKKLRSELFFSAEKSFKVIEKCIIEKEYERVVFEAHKLKGSFGNAKEMELYEAVTVLEKMAREMSIQLEEGYHNCLKIFKERF